MAGGALAIDGLVKSYGDLRVLAGVSFTVQPGRILGFLGRNGSGKTTTMRCIFGLLDAEAGTITYEGRRLTTATRQAFGYMPEERGLYPRMRVLPQLVHFARLAGMSAGEAAKASAAWLERLELAERSAARVEQLSHGNQQRVQLAVALVHGPDVLILDEPFSGLDPVGVAEMGEVLREAAEAGSTILFSSHQLDLVEGLCTDIAILHDGHVVEYGDLERIRSRADYRRAEVTVDGRPWLPDVPGVRVVEGERAHVMVPASVSAPELLEAARRAGSITSFRYEPPRLSDLFLAAVEATGAAGVTQPDEGGTAAGGHDA
ncbi:MAG: ATP-binding cassette domain-containing protein [Candidatus Nanopelagicales bacterium]